MCYNMDMELNYRWRPRGRFIQLPMQVVNFLIEVRPAMMNKVYMYLYNRSIAAGKHNTPMLSAKEMAKILNVKPTIVYRMLKWLMEMNAIEIEHQLRGRGTSYLVNLPLKTETGWMFLSPQKCPYLYEKGEKAYKKPVQDQLF